MEARPPELIERIIGPLIPPACREEVLGDWSERYRSQWQYVWDAVKTLPFIIASRTRRAFRIELFLVQACALYAAFSGASLARGPAYFHESSVLMPLGIVIGIKLLALSVGDAYADPRDKSSRNVLLPIGFALTLAYTSQILLRVTKPALMLPSWIFFVGTAFSVAMLIIVRKWFETMDRRTPRVAGKSGTIEELRRKSEEVHRRARQLDFAASWLIPVAVFALFVAWLYVGNLK